MGKTKVTPVAVISSTALDLPEHRKKVMDACLEQNLFPKMMEHLPASPEDAIKASMSLVDSADIYIGIIAFRYGYVPEGFDISITEMEYNHALQRKIPTLIFLMDDEHPLKKSDVETGAGAVKLERLRERMKKGPVVNFFKSSDDLKAKVLNSLSNYLQRGNDQTLLYDTAIVEMFHPAQSSYGVIMNQIEPFPGFPYFSQESDHPSQWPPRVFKERTAFYDQIIHILSGEAANELAAWRKISPPKISRPGTPPDDPVLNYASLRMLLNEQQGDFDAVKNTVGRACAQALIELEAGRHRLEENTPNRLLIVRVVNGSDEDITNFHVEISLSGSVYDVTVNAMGKQAKSEEWTPNRFSIELPLLQPNYQVDLYVWYYYQPLESKVFPGAMDFKWAQTQGIVVENLVASGVRITHSGELLNDLPAYQRYPVDPVRNSPTFGTLETAPQEQTAETEEPVEEDFSYLRIAAPREDGPYALFLYIPVMEFYRQKNDAYEAQMIYSNALSKFYDELKREMAAQQGRLIYEWNSPVDTSFSRFTGEYSVKGSLLVIFKANELIDFTKFAGTAIIKNIANINADYVPWNKAKYEVVLHFFTDTKDTAGDSKRVLTNRLSLDEIFDTTTPMPVPNRIAPAFKRLLEYTHYCLVKYYKQPFMLEQEGKDSAPFYIVARNNMVSENIYLPASWMKIDDVSNFEQSERTALSASLSRMYDYGNQSKELEKEAFKNLFC